MASEHTCSQSSLGSSVSGSHFGLRREPQGKATAGHSIKAGVGGVSGEASSLEETIDKSGRLGNSATIFKTPSRSDKKKHRGSSSLSGMSLRSELDITRHAGSETLLLDAGGTSTLPNPCGTSHPMDSTSHLRGTAHSVCDTPNMITSHTTIWTPELRGAKTPAVPQHLVTSHPTSRTPQPEGHSPFTSTARTSKLRETNHPTPSTLTPQLTKSHNPTPNAVTPQLIGTDHSTLITGTLQLRASNYTTPNSGTAHLKGSSHPTTTTWTPQLEQASHPTTIVTTTPKGSASSHRKNGEVKSDLFQVKNMTRAHEILADQVQRFRLCVVKKLF